MLLPFFEQKVVPGRVAKLRKSRRDEARRIDAKIKLQRTFRRKYSSNSLVLVETVLPQKDESLKEKISPVSEKDAEQPQV